MFLGANTLECESSRERKFPGQFAPGDESSREREGQGAKRPGSEKARERKGQAAKAPGSELARVLLADSLQGANWPGSEKAVNPVVDGHWVGTVGGTAGGTGWVGGTFSPAIYIGQKVKTTEDVKIVFFHEYRESLKIDFS